MRFFGVKKNALERLELYRDETERGTELSGALFSRALKVSLLFGAVFNEKISRFVNPFSRENASEKTSHFHCALPYCRTKESQGREIHTRKAERKEKG